MELRNLMEPTILIIEDVEKTLMANERYINQIDKDRKEQLGIARFIIDKVNSVEAAIERLAQHVSSPYNIVLLDMHLPGAINDQYDTGSYTTQETVVYRGYEILNFIAKTRAAEAVIVVSAFPENMLDVFRRGAFDFIIKPRQKEELQERVLICWSRLLLKKCRLVFNERISDLVPSAEKGLAHRFTTCFSSLVLAVAHSAEDIERYMHERYGLDRQKDSQEFLFRCLRWQEDSVNKAKDEWGALQSALLSAEESTQAETVETLLQEIHQSLLPCLIVKNVVLRANDGSAIEVLTFEDDVRAVLKEIITGALETLHNYNETEHPIDIKIGNADGQVKVSFADRLKPISSEDANKINEGSNISPHRRFEREWGLSVVQHIAMRGGGRIEIEPQAQGNVVNYFIPLAH